MVRVIFVLVALFVALVVASVVHAEEGRKTRVVSMEVTAYCPCKKCCGPNAQGITASGRPVSANGGKFCAAPRNYKFGTKMIVPGYNDGNAIPVYDRGGAIKGNHLDVYFPTHQEARNWGRQMLDVTVEE